MLGVGSVPGDVLLGVSVRLRQAGVGWVILTGVGQQCVFEVCVGFGWLSFRAVGRVAGKRLWLSSAGLPFACTLGSPGS
jgi:hypothetical protein